MEYTIFYQGSEIGCVTVEPEGLYYRLSAACAEPGHGVWRLWGCFGADSRCLGVLYPEAGGLKLERRVSRHSWAILPEAFAIFAPPEGPLPFAEQTDRMREAELGGRSCLLLDWPPEELKVEN